VFLGHEPCKLRLQFLGAALAAAILLEPDAFRLTPHALDLRDHLVLSFDELAAVHGRSLAG
jgi:hypothetical protein